MPSHECPGPDFIVAGLMKTSTSWLYQVLAKNDNFDMPLIKETHYFSYLQSRKSGLSGEMALENVMKNVRAENEWFEDHSKEWSEDYKEIHKGKLYALNNKPLSENWYRGLFEIKRQGKLSGDLTPNYATLDTMQLELIRELHNPSVILIFRNPLTRFWSGLRMRADLNSLDVNDEQMVLAELNKEGSQINLDYRGIYENYFKVFGSSLRVFSYEKIHQDTQGFFDEFCNHIGAPKSKIGTNSDEVVFLGPKLKMPKWLWDYAIERQLDSRLMMKELFPDQSAGWACPNLSQTNGPRRSRVNANRSFEQNGVFGNNSNFSKSSIHFLHISKCAGTEITRHLDLINENHPNKSIKTCAHNVKLKDIPIDSPYFFSIRDPITRFFSGFYCRKRKGMPRYTSEWSADETKAFANFDNANFLAESLFLSGELGQKASEAMKSIYHVAMNQIDWFIKVENFLEIRPPVHIIRQEFFDKDLAVFIKKLGIENDLIIERDPVLSHENNYEGIPSLSELSISNLKIWYAQDIEFYKICSDWIEKNSSL